MSTPSDAVTTKVISEFQRAPHSVVVNVAEIYIVTTRRNVKDALRTFQDGVAARNAWQTPFSLGATFLVALVTCDFKEILGLKKETWQALFLLSFVVCCIWLAVALMRIFRTWASGGIEHAINSIAADAGAATPQQPPSTPPPPPNNP